MNKSGNFKEEVEERDKKEMIQILILKHLLIMLKNEVYLYPILLYHHEIQTQDLL